MQKGFKIAISLSIIICLLLIGSLISGYFLFQQRERDSSIDYKKRGDLELAFSDEFDQPRLDSSKWVDCYWWDVEGCTNAGNHELEWYLPNNVVLDRGTLVLEARKEVVSDKNGELFPYSSGIVTTGRDVSDTSLPTKFSFQYGYVEIKAKFPSGKGLWPAIWLLPITHESRPEIDILEMLGNETNAALVHVHYLDKNQERQSVGHTQFVPDLADGWQTIGLDWREDKLSWFINDIPVWEITDPEIIPDEPLYLILNLAVGGDYPGTPDSSTVFPAQFKIDYVRIWQ